ncbi:unnamed protein product [Pedinophyceae sp. YPF-701]|nr:unnamed protein product [Pedinophyceae sp. YPF-701]
MQERIGLLLGGSLMGYAAYATIQQHGAELLTHRDERSVSLRAAAMILAGTVMILMSYISTVQLKEVRLSGEHLSQRTAVPCCSYDLLPVGTRAADTLTVLKK